MEIVKQQVLSNEEARAIGLLSLGTFLEYFDLMLYVHMAGMLNELFFPKSDPATGALLTAFSFCSLYLLRPLGAVVFGYIGDKFGRMIIVIITTFIMAGSCCVISILPTYNTIGITATVIITICRMLQGVSSMGEVVASEIYLTEFIRKPFRYPAVAFLTISCLFGGIVALLVSFVAVSSDYLWRGAFFFGALVAVIGFRARVALKETAVFSDARNRIKAQLIEHEQFSNVYFLKAHSKTILSFAFMQCAWPFCFYFSIVYCSEILKSQFGYSTQDIISHNLIVCVAQLIAYSVFCILSYKLPPLKILQVRLYSFLIFVLFCPILLNTATRPFDIMLIQAATLILAATDIPAAPVVYSHFPILQRFRITVFIYAICRVIVYTIGSFGLIYLVGKFGNWGILILMGPIALSTTYAVHHFQNLEEKEHFSPLSPEAYTALPQS